MRINKNKFSIFYFSLNLKRLRRGGDERLHVLRSLSFFPARRQDYIIPKLKVKNEKNNSIYKTFAAFKYKKILSYACGQRHILSVKSSGNLNGKRLFFLEWGRRPFVAQ